MSNPLIPRKFFSVYLPDDQIPRFVALGHSVNPGSDQQPPIFVLENEDRTEHMYVCGLTKSGKTRFLENLIIQDIALNHPICVIDPTGGLYNKALNFIAHCVEECRYRPDHTDGFTEGEVDRLLEDYLFLNLDDPQNPLRFNPLEASEDESTEEAVDDLMKTAERLFGSVDETRRLRQTLRNTLWVIAELNRLQEEERPSLPNGFAYDLNLDFAAEFLSLNRDYRDTLVRAIPDTAENRFVRQFWLNFFTRHQDYQAQERLESTWNVLQYFLGDTLVRRFFSCHESTLRISQLLREKKSLFCHLPLGKNLKGSQLVGTFLATKYQHSAYRRSMAARKNAYYLYIDEFHEFADEQFAKASATLRQYGLHMINAHQSQDQPPFHTPEGQSILETIKGNAGIKVLFRLSRKDAETLSKEMFELSQRKFHFAYSERSTSFAEATGTVNTVTFQKTESRNRTYTRTTTETLGRSETFAIQNSQGTNISKTLTEGIGRNMAEGLTRSISATEGRGITEVWSKNDGISIAIGEGWSQMIDHRTGFTYTEDGQESLSVQRGTTKTQTKGEQTGETETKGGNFTVTDTEGNKLTTTQGKSVAFNQKGGDSRESQGSNLGKMTQKARAEGQNYSTALQTIKNVSQAHAKSKSKTRSNSGGFSGSESQSTGISEGLSGNVNLSLSQGLGQQKGIKRDLSHGRTEGHTRTITESEQKSLAEAFAVLRQFSESMSEAIQTTAATAKAEAMSTGTSITEGSQFAKSQTLSKTESSAERIVFYTLEGERELGINTLQKLPRRHCVVSKTALAAQEIETLLVPDGYFSQWDEDGPATLIQRQRQRLAPTDVPQPEPFEKEPTLPFQVLEFGGDSDPFEF